ncbi:Uncharacterised protein [Klebsiella aerogenes]|nr:Uncharacterised protein [Klebsiella aerogenes]
MKINTPKQTTTNRKSNNGAADKQHLFCRVVAESHLSIGPLAAIYLRHWKAQKLKAGKNSFIDALALLKGC